jgi:hypothetical protein
VQDARSTRVEVGSVRGIPATWRRSSGLMPTRRCTRMPGRRRAVLLGTTTSISASGAVRARPQSAAALRWLRRASGPQLNTAAIHHPFRSTSGLPTAYTPRQSGCRRPLEIRCLIESGPNPTASSCVLVTTPCCARARSQTGPAARGSFWGSIVPQRLPTPLLRPPCDGQGEEFGAIWARGGGRGTALRASRIP